MAEYASPGIALALVANVHRVRNAVLPLPRQTVTFISCCCMYRLLGCASELLCVDGNYTLASTESDVRRV